MLDDIIVTKNCYHNIKYNFKLSCPENCSVVVISNGEARKMSSMERYILNPYTCLADHLRLDSKTYLVYYIKNNCFDGSWGGNISYFPPSKTSKTKKVFLRANFNFVIKLPEKFITLLYGDENEYNLKQVNVRINDTIDAIVKNFILNELTKNGFKNTFSNLPSLINLLEDVAKETTLEKYGFLVTNLRLELEESKE